MDQIKSFFSTHDHFAKHCGIELVHADVGEAKVRMDVHKFHMNGVDVVHGGAIFTLADFAFAIASNSHGSIAMGINVSINFIKSAFAGTLVAEAKEISRNPKLATYFIEVKNEQNDLIATFQGTVYRKKEKLDFNKKTNT